VGAHPADRAILVELAANPDGVFPDSIGLSGVDFKPTVDDGNLLRLVSLHRIVDCTGTLDGVDGCEPEGHHLWVSSAEGAAGIGD
jgi:hypothetical protein